MTLALTERQPQQTHENREIVAAAWLYHQGLLDENFEQFFKCRFVLGLGLTPLQLFIKA
ncbi:hypothetical protein D3C84_1072310 [compost metagenome]